MSTSKTDIGLPRLALSAGDAAELLGISRQENRAFFLSAYNVTGGLGAAAGPILAGLALSKMGHLDLHLFTWKISQLQIIFMTSTLLRLLSFQFIRRLQEPEAGSVGEVIRILRSIRGMGITNGFNYLLHPFIVIEKEIREETV